MLISKSVDSVSRVGLANVMENEEKKQNKNKTNRSTYRGVGSTKRVKKSINKIFIQMEATNAAAASPTSNIADDVQVREMRNGLIDYLSSLTSPLQVFKLVQPRIKCLRSSARRKIINKFPAARRIYIWNESFRFSLEKILSTFSQVLSVIKVSKR